LHQQWRRRLPAGGMLYRWFAAARTVALRMVVRRWRIWQALWVVLSDTRPELRDAVEVWRAFQLADLRRRVLEQRRRTGQQISLKKLRDMINFWREAILESVLFRWNERAEGWWGEAHRRKIEAEVAAIEAAKAKKKQDASDAQRLLEEEQASEQRRVEEEAAAAEANANAWRNRGPHASDSDEDEPIDEGDALAVARRKVARAARRAQVMENLARSMVGRMDGAGMKRTITKARKLAEKLANEEGSQWAVPVLLEKVGEAEARLKRMHEREASPQARVKKTIRSVWQGIKLAGQASDSPPQPDL